MVASGYTSETKEKYVRRSAAAPRNRATAYPHAYNNTRAPRTCSFLGILATASERVLAPRAYLPCRRPSAH
eukprot:scaffold62423_cov30-Tisochrysis_lutea.AAC.4